MKYIYFCAFTFGLLVVEPLPVYSDGPVPPPPAFSVTGKLTNGGNPSWKSSNQHLDFSIANNVAFRTISFSMDGDPAKLAFSSYCSSNDTQGVGFSEGPYEKGAYCPQTPDPSRSLGIRKVKLRLMGADKDLYSVTYECWIGCADQPAQVPGGQHEAGEWCGNMDAAARCWVARMAIDIRQVTN